MTTRIEIKNVGHGNITVVAVDPTKENKIVDTSFAPEVLAPGEAVSKYIWQDLAILVKE